jgi:pheromone a factor receptor
VLVRIHRYRKQFSDILRISNSNLTSSRFIRLLLLAVILVAVNLPLSFYVLYRNIIVGLIPYDWALVHGADWYFIHRLPTYDFVQFDRWISVGSGFLLFIFFGMGNDAARMYQGWLESAGIGKHLPDFIMGRKKPKKIRYSGARKGSSLASYLSKRFALKKPLLSGTTNTNTR